MTRVLTAIVLLCCCAGCGGDPAVLQGVVECDEQTLAFEVAGTIAETPAAEGAAVAAGAVLARLEGSDLRLIQAEAKARVEQARRELAAVAAPARAQELAAAEAESEAAASLAATASAERDRFDRLQATGLASDAERDRARDGAASAIAQARSAREHLALLREGPRPETVAAAEAALAVAERGLARASERLARSVITAPGPRIVRHIHLEPGEVAQPGAAAVTVADLAHPYVDAFVPQARLAGLHLGGAATIRVDGHAPVAGSIERIGERLEYTPRYLFGPKDRPDLVARVRVRLASGDGLQAGVPADVTFAP